jgi:hypothetical protein
VPQSDKSDFHDECSCAHCNWHRSHRARRRVQIRCLTT